MLLFCAWTGALFVILNQTPNMKMLGLLQVKHYFFVCLFVFVVVLKELVLYTWAILLKVTALKFLIIYVYLKK